MLPLRRRKLGREPSLIHTCVRVGATGKNQEYKITEPKARKTQNPTGTRTDGGTWISLSVVLLSMVFMTGKAVGCLDFVHSPPSLPSGQRVHLLRQPPSYHGIKSGPSCPVTLPSRCYTTLHPSGRDPVPALLTRPFHWASWRGPQHLVSL